MGVTGGGDVPFWDCALAQLGRWRFATAIARVRLSKIDDYLADNVCCYRLSDLGHAVNDKAQSGTGALGNSSGEPRPLAKNARRTGHPRFVDGESMGQPQ